MMSTQRRLVYEWLDDEHTHREAHREAWFMLQDDEHPEKPGL